MDAQDFRLAEPTIIYTLRFPRITNSWQKVGQLEKNFGLYNFYVTKSFIDFPERKQNREEK